MWHIESALIYCTVCITFRNWLVAIAYSIHCWIPPDIWSSNSIYRAKCTSYTQDKPLRPEWSVLCVRGYSQESAWWEWLLTDWFGRLRYTSAEGIGEWCQRCKEPRHTRLAAKSEPHRTHLAAKSEPCPARHSGTLTPNRANLSTNRAHLSAKWAHLSTDLSQPRGNIRGCWLCL